MGIVSGWINNVKSRAGHDKVKLFTVMGDGGIFTSPNNKRLGFNVTDRFR